jgi:two-component sensor histidine kinase
MDKRSPVARLTHLARHGLPPRSPAAFGFAVLCVVVATLLRLAVDLFAPDAVPFATYFPAVLVATLIAGRTAGALATVLSVVAGWYLFVEPRYVWPGFSAVEIASVLLFFLAAGVVMWVADGFRRVLRRLDREEHYRQVVVDELGHRVKNKLATIYAILRHELRGHSDIWHSVSGRLRALSAADDFLVRPDEAGVDLREILDMELRPYGENRVHLRGGPCAFNARVSGVLALVVHELATNAAKYGALSREEGRVEIKWREEKSDVLIEWTETGGPPVVAPEKRSFGSNLIERSLDGFNGSARLEFAPGGVICRICAPKAPPPRANSAAA